MATILVVDDDRVFCDLLKVVLGGNGHEVLTACNGREALKLFSQHRPQFTLLDLRMPDMSGIEVLRKIRTIDARATVMILTAWGSDALEKQARRFGVTDFLSKTLTLDKIVGSMERLLPPATRVVEPPLQPTERTGSPSTRTVEDCRNPDCLAAKKTLPKARKKKSSALRRPPRR